MAVSFFFFFMTYRESLMKRVTGGLYFGCDITAILSVSVLVVQTSLQT